MARCNNSAVVAIIRGGTSRTPQEANLMKCLTFLSAVYEFSVGAIHLAGVHNTSADALSRNNLPMFRILNPQANQGTTAVPAMVLDLILLQEPDWKARDWTSQWSSSWTPP